MSVVKIVKSIKHVLGGGWGYERKQRERESRGVKSFPFVCPPDGHSAIMLLLRGRPHLYIKGLFA